MPVRTFCSNGDETLLPERIDRGEQDILVPVVLEPHVGGLVALLVGCLGGDPAACVRLGHPARVHQPLHPRLRCGPHDHDEVVAGSVVLLHQQGHVVHDDRVVRGRGHQLGRATGDERVGDAFEVAAGAAVGEDDRPERGTVEGALVIEDFLAEPVDDGGESRAARCDHLSGEEVGVDHQRHRAPKAAVRQWISPNRCLQ